MAHFHLTQAAKTDLKGIGRHTEQRWGRAQRNNYLAMLDQGFQDLAAEPLRGRDCSNIREGYRRYSVGRHVIFYRRIAPDMIEIVRVLHDRMNLERHLPALVRDEGNGHLEAGMRLK
jgi:toxin ParE1/3/4